MKNIKLFSVMITIIVLTITCALSVSAVVVYPDSVIQDSPSTTEFIVGDLTGSGSGEGAKNSYLSFVIPWYKYIGGTKLYVYANSSYDFIDGQYVARSSFQNINIGTSKVSVGQGWNVWNYTIWSSSFSIKLGPATNVNNYMNYFAQDIIHRPYLVVSMVPEPASITCYIFCSLMIAGMAKKKNKR
jgi:hypothetical protein